MLAHRQDPAGFRAAWDILERLWDETVARDRGVRPDLEWEHRLYAERDLDVPAGRST